MTSHSPAVQQFWADYRATLDDRHPHHQRVYSAWAFGDSPELADDLLALVLSGKKIATASAIWSYEDDNEPEPYVGELSIILDGAGQPQCIIETVEIFVKPFDEVPADFAKDEGEGDLSLAYWRDAHERFFTREFASNGNKRTFSPQMPVLCERFTVIYRR
ncbi:MAG: ASCH domain-containing protein [Chloroflexota bacterium]